MDRLSKKALEQPLTSEDLERLQKIIALNALVVAPTLVKDVPTLDQDTIVEEFKAQRPKELFPRRGPKATTRIHEPPTPAKG
jgi:hypothetical protein